MTNKTLEQRVVRPAEGFATLAGHALVIANEAGGGRKHVQTFMPGEKVKLPWLRSELSGYHVALDEYLRSAFGSAHLHRDGVHSFTLAFELEYRVLSAQPWLIALRSAEDPLAKLEQEVKRVLGTQLSALPWKVLESRSDWGHELMRLQSLADNGEMVLNSERLRAYASEWGIELRQVSVARHLSEEDVEVGKKSASLERKRELVGLEIADRKLQGELESTEIDIKSDLDVKRAQAETRVATASLPKQYIDGTKLALLEVSSKASSFHEIHRGFQHALQIADSVARAGAGYGRGETANFELGAGSIGSTLQLGPGGLPAASAGLTATLQSACEVAAGLVCPEGDRKRFLGAMLRVVAGTLDGADDVDETRRRLTELHALYAQDMSDDHSSFVQHLRRGG
jgi:hypothetical protein